jgi:hypothetical protein
MTAFRQAVPARAGRIRPRSRDVAPTCRPATRCEWARAPGASLRRDRTVSATRHPPRGAVLGAPRPPSASRVGRTPAATIAARIAPRERSAGRQKTLGQQKQRTFSAGFNLILGGGLCGGLDHLAAKQLDGRLLRPHIRYWTLLAAASRFRFPTPHDRAKPFRSNCDREHSRGWGAAYGRPAGVARGQPSAPRVTSSSRDGSCYSALERQEAVGPELGSGHRPRKPSDWLCPPHAGRR